MHESCTDCCALTSMGSTPNHGPVMRSILAVSLQYLAAWYHRWYHETPAVAGMLCVHNIAPLHQNINGKHVYQSETVNSSADHAT